MRTAGPRTQTVVFRSTYAPQLKGHKALLSQSMPVQPSKYAAEILAFPLAVAKDD